MLALAATIVADKQATAQRAPQDARLKAEHARSGRVLRSHSSKRDPEILTRKEPKVVKKYKPFNLIRLRKQAARGPAVMMAFNAVREPPNPFAYPPLPGGVDGKAFYHGWLHRKTGTVNFYFDDEVVKAEKMETFEDLLGGPVPAFLEGTIPMITTRLMSPLPLWKHVYLDQRGMLLIVALVGRT